MESRVNPHLIPDATPLDGEPQSRSACYTLDANSPVIFPGQTDGYTVADPPQLESTSAPSHIDYLHPDHLGTVRAITDTSQTVIWRWDSTPFGDTLPNEDPDGDGQALRFNLRFPGQYFDTETGLHYNYFRDYDPATGRYVQSDPIGLDGGLNTYGYALQNPLMFTDPTGQAAAICLIPGVCPAIGGAILRVCISVGSRVFPASLFYSAEACSSGGSSDSYSDCAPIQAEINSLVAQLQQRYEDLFIDRHSLFLDHHTLIPNP